MKIIIDPYRGGQDTGQNINNKYEKNLLLELSKYMSEEFNKQGIDTELVRTNDVQLSDDERNSIINEIKNIVITVVVATSVVQGSLTLSFLCLIRIEQEQPSSNICSFYKRNIDERWILYSPQRLILPIQGNVH